MVKAGRLKELGQMANFEVWEYVLENAGDGKTVKVKWVDILRGDEVRSRLVAIEFAYDLRGDTHAGMRGV